MKNYIKTIKIMTSPLMFMISLTLFLACKKNETEQKSLSAYKLKKIMVSQQIAAPGETIYITGRFEGAVENATVKIGNQSALITSGGSGVLQVVVPEQETKAKLSITLEGETLLSDNDFSIKQH